MLQAVPSHGPGDSEAWHCRLCTKTHTHTNTYAHATHAHARARARAHTHTHTHTHAHTCTRTHTHTQRTGAGRPCRPAAEQLSARPVPGALLTRGSGQNLNSEMLAESESRAESRPIPSQGSRSVTQMRVASVCLRNTPVKVFRVTGDLKHARPKTRIGLVVTQAASTVAELE